jgi:hypothetical protein
MPSSLEAWVRRDRRRTGCRPAVVTLPPLGQTSGACCCFLVLAGGGGLGALFGNRRQSFLNRVAQQGNNNRPQTFVPTVGESLLLAYIQSASDLYGPMLQG